VRNALYNLVTIDAGVRAGATTIPQPAASKSGTPRSASGGMSGAAGKRAAEVTPRAGKGRRGVGKQQSNMSANHVGERRRTAFIGRHTRQYSAQFMLGDQAVKKGPLFLCPVCVPLSASAGPPLPAALDCLRVTVFAIALWAEGRRKDQTQ
jgi:hypothetical protein